MNRLFERPTRNGPLTRHWLATPCFGCQERAPQLIYASAHARRPRGIRRSARPFLGFIHNASGSSRRSNPGGQVPIRRYGGLRGHLSTAQLRHVQPGVPHGREPYRSGGSPPRDLPTGLQQAAELRRTGRLWNLVVSIGSQPLPRSSQKWCRTQTIGNQEPGRVDGNLSLRCARVDFGSTRSRERHRATPPFLPVGLLALRRPGIRPSRGGGYIGRRGRYVEVSRPQSQAEATRALGEVSTGEKR